MSQLSDIQDAQELAQDQPQLIFSTDLEGAELQQMLFAEHVLDELVEHRYGLALAMIHLNDTQADVVRQLNAAGVYLVARLLLLPTDGYWLNLQNYPQAVQHYHTFREWAAHHQLTFAAVGLDIEPPYPEVAKMGRWRLGYLLRRLWQARENILYPAALDAYQNLISDIHYDGYEVHVFQIPLIADDRRAGTTLLQRTIDIVDLPADLEVLMCPSNLPIASLENDLGGALITSYGPDADSIGVGNINPPTTGSSALDSGDTIPALSWVALERDLLLAARYTDTLYVFSLEGCAHNGLLQSIGGIDWDCEPQWSRQRRAIVSTWRTLLLLTLLFVRFYKVMFAWLGWIVAITLWLQKRSTASKDKLQ